MRKSVVLGLFVFVLALAVGLTACSRPASTPASPTAPTPKAEPKAAPKAAAPAAAEGVALNAQTIVGSKWKYQAFEFDFEPDGALKVNGQIPGKWSIEGNKLKVSAMSNEYVVDIQGSKLVFEGKDLQRVK